MFGRASYDALRHLWRPGDLKGFLGRAVFGKYNYDISSHNP